MTSLGASEPLTLGSRTEYESYTCSELHKVRPAPQTLAELSPDA